MKIKIYNLKTIGLLLDAKSLEIRKRKGNQRKEKKISGIKKGERRKLQETNHEHH